MSSSASFAAGTTPFPGGSYRNPVTGVLDQNFVNYDFNRDGSLNVQDLFAIANQVTTNCFAQQAVPVPGQQTKF